MSRPQVWATAGDSQQARTSPQQSMTLNYIEGSDFPYNFLNNLGRCNAEELTNMVLCELNVTPEELPKKKQDILRCAKYGLWMNMPDNRKAKVFRLNVVTNENITEIGLVFMNTKEGAPGQA